MLFLTLRRDELETLLEILKLEQWARMEPKITLNKYSCFFFPPPRKRIVIRVVKKKKKKRNQDIDFVAFCTTLNFSILLIGASEKEK